MARKRSRMAAAMYRRIPKVPGYRGAFHAWVARFAPKPVPRPPEGHDRFACLLNLRRLRKVPMKNKHFPPCPEWRKWSAWWAIRFHATNNIWPDDCGLNRGTAITLLTDAELDAALEV